MHINDTGSASGDRAVQMLGEITIQREKTRRISLLISLILGILLSLILVFAPEGRETISYIVSGIMGILSLGCLGYSSIGFKLKFFEFWTKRY